MHTLLCFLILGMVDEPAENTNSGPPQAEPRETFKVPAETVRTVRAFLPSSNGWLLKEKADSLVVRQEPGLWVQRILPGSPPSEPGKADDSRHVENYEITLRCQPRMTREQHAATMQDLDKRIKRLKQSMKAFRIPQPTKSWPPYHPRNADEEAQLRELRRLLKRQDDLPDYFDNRVSLDIHDSLGPYGYIERKEDRADCKRMLRTMQGMFQRYDQGEPMTDSQRIRGEWEIVSVIAGGKTVESARDTRCVFSDREWRTVQFGKPETDEKNSLRTISRTYALAANTPFNHIDDKLTQRIRVWQHLGTDGVGLSVPGFQDIKWYSKGIYKIEGDRLTICWGDVHPREPDAIRPTAFVSKPGDRRSLIVLRRYAGPVPNNGL